MEQKDAERLQQLLIDLQYIIDEDAITRFAIPGFESRANNAPMPPRL